MRNPTRNGCNCFRSARQSPPSTSTAAPLDLGVGRVSKAIRRQLKSEAHPLHSPCVLHGLRGLPQHGDCHAILSSAVSTHQDRVEGIVV